MLDGLESGDEDEDLAADHFLAERAAPAHLPKALAPDGNLPTAMGWDDSPSEAGGDVIALQIWVVVNVCGEERRRVLQQGCSFRAQAGTASQEGRTRPAQVGAAMADGTTFVAQAPAAGH